MDADTQRPMRTYGRVRGRPLRQGRSRLMDERLAALTLGLSSGRLELGGRRAIWVEIGFGGGEHLAAQAERNPEVLLLGAEPFVNGQASLVAHVQTKRLRNVRFHPGDARELMAALPDGSVGRLFILFPDPWPKARHRKRRLIQADTIAEFARVLTPGGALRFATDWRDYADWTLERILRSGLFDWPAERADDWRVPPLDHVTTRYETKRLGDCAPVFFDFIRRS